MITIDRGETQVASIVTVLDAMCVSLELTEAQRELARQRSAGVGKWLAESDSPLLRALLIYFQGSTAIGTTVRPWNSAEHDVDLVSLNPSLAGVAPSALKRAIGDRLRENGHYAPLLEEKGRCWRLTYANDFHMDVTPAIANPACDNGGELVPDRTLNRWKASNPKGFKALFERRAALVPTLRMKKAHDFATASQRGHVEPFPENGRFKGVLRRAVQIQKRHRDVHFADADPCLAPISVIITQLTAQSYEQCVRDTVYDDEFELLRDVLSRMPDFISTQRTATGMRWSIENETTSGENFAEKWNDDPRRAEAFFAWHGRLCIDMAALPVADGLDNARRRLGDAFGRETAAAAMSSVTDRLDAARQTGRLALAPTVLGGGAGLIGGTPAAAAATPIPRNTFYGRG